MTSSIKQKKFKLGSWQLIKPTAPCKPYSDLKKSIETTTRWVDVVQRDALRLLGIRGWRRRAANKDEWRRLVREAKAWKGL
jgi:hypothetical protein